MYNRIKILTGLIMGLFLISAVFFIFPVECGTAEDMMSEIAICTASGVQSVPSVAYDPSNSRFLVVWVDDYPSCISGQLVNADGSLNGSSFVIHEDLGINPVVTYDSINQRFLVVWDNYLDVFGQLVNADGSLYGSMINIVTVQATQADPAVVYDSSNQRFLVVWYHSFYGPYSDIYGQLINSDGSLYGSNFAVCVEQGRNRDPSLGYDQDNERFLVTWSGYRQATDNDIYGQLVNSDGTMFGGSFVISSQTTGVWSSSVDYDSVNRRFLVLWTGQTPLLEHNIYGQLVNADGGLYGINFPICTAPYRQYNPSITYISDSEKFFVIWHDDRNISSFENGTDIYAQFVNPDGTVPLYGHDFEISKKLQNQLYPSVAYCPDNKKLLIAWEDWYNHSTTHFDIYGKLYSSCIIVVPDDYSTIQEAINASSDGFEIIIKEGIYEETIDFLGKAITVRSIYPDVPDVVDATVIDAGGKGSVVTFHNGEGKDSVLNGITIKNGSGYNGGGIYCVDSSPTIKNCVISNNEADSHGGGIYSLWGNPDITNCNISGNNGGGLGGGIYSLGGMYSFDKNLDITNCNINGNTAAGGSGIYFSDGNLHITDCTISGNIADGSGGGIHCYNTGIVTITNCIINSNNSNENGGGIYFDKSSPSIINCTISSNDSENEGGGIFFNDSSSPNITNSSISDNFTCRSGGGIYCNGSSPNIKNCVISNNNIWGSGGGGGIYCNGSSPNIKNCVISNNYLWGSGGGICCISSSPTITNCTISGNYSENGGGGIFLNDSSSPNITNSSISGNFTYSGGGGIYCASSSLTITNCTIERNTTYISIVGGGGIYCDGSSPTITNCIISGNYSKNEGGGIYCASSSPTITNCIIVGNDSMWNDGGGIYCDGFSAPVVTNCIIWENTPDSIYVPGDRLIPITYTCIQGGYGGTIGNISTNPKFVDPAGGDYHLLSTSPCIDGGNDAVAPIADKDGIIRPAGGNINTGTACDMGAYEYVYCDINSDGDINRYDFLILMTAYGSCIGDAGFNPKADLDGDGCVTINDYRIFRYYA